MNTRTEIAPTEIDPRVTRVLVDTLGVDEVNITAGAKLQQDLLADSLDVVQVVMGIEEEFSIEISDDQMNQIVTVGDVMQLVTNLTAEN